MTEKDTIDSRLTELLADVRRECDRQGLDFGEIDKQAYSLYLRTKGIGFSMLYEGPKVCGNCGSDDVDQYCVGWVPFNANLDITAVDTLEDLHKAEVYSVTTFCNECQRCERPAENVPIIDKEKS